MRCGARTTSRVAALYDIGRIGEQLRDSGIVVHDLAMASNRDVAVIPRLVRLMRRGKYDVVHVHLYRACLYGRVAATIARVPVVVTTEHSLGTRLMEGRPITATVRGLYRATDRLSRRTIAVSSVVRDRLVSWGIAPAKIVVNSQRRRPRTLRVPRRAARRGTQRPRVRRRRARGRGHRTPGAFQGLRPRGAGLLHAARRRPAGHRRRRSRTRRDRGSRPAARRSRTASNCSESAVASTSCSPASTSSCRRRSPARRRLGWRPSRRSRPVFRASSHIAPRSTASTIPSWCGVPPRRPLSPPRSSVLAAVVATGSAARRAPVALERFGIDGIVLQIDALYDDLNDDSARRRHAEVSHGAH